LIDRNNHVIEIDHIIKQIKDHLFDQSDQIKVMRIIKVMRQIASSNEKPKVRSKWQSHSYHFHKHQSRSFHFQTKIIVKQSLCQKVQFQHLPSTKQLFKNSNSAYAEKDRTLFCLDIK